MVFFLILIAPVILIALYEYASFRRRRAQDQSMAVKPKLALAALVAAVAGAAIFFRWLQATHLDQTAALFIGVPALLAVTASFLTPASPVGIAVKAVTIGLLVSLIFLHEGFLCIAMSAPLFYLVAVLIGKSVDELNRPDHHGRYLSGIALLAMLPMSLEGVSAATTIDRDVTVSATRIVNASARDVSAAIHSTPRFERKLPRYLAMGFPRPVSTTIDGNTWIIRMRGGETRFNGTEPRTGDLVLQRDSEDDGFVRWRAVADDSHMTHFLKWQQSQVDWHAIDATHTRVTWTLRYRRGLDPAWYFGPMERYATTLAAGYLIDAVATP
jgi:hypothetical protein